jgi:hypothetical protein
MVISETIVYFKMVYNGDVLLSQSENETSSKQQLRTLRKRNNLDP